VLRRLGTQAVGELSSFVPPLNELCHAGGELILHEHKTQREMSWGRISFTREQLAFGVLAFGVPKSGN
jgi:hypothetical protein